MVKSKKVDSKQQKQIIVGIVVLLVLGAGGYFLFGQGFGDNVVASVNGEEITASEVAAMQDLSVQQGQQVSEENALEQIIAREILVQEAGSSGYDLSDVEAEEMLESQLLQRNSSLEEYKQNLETQGVVYEEQLGELKEQLVIQEYLAEEVGEDKYSVTKEEAKDFYEQYKAQYPEEEIPSYSESETQIIMILQQQKQQQAVGALIEELKMDADIEYY